VIIIGEQAKQEFVRHLAWQRSWGIKTAFANYLKNDPQHAIEHANECLNAGNRAEYQQEVKHLPVIL
jgi:hypothetical protein